MRKKIIVDIKGIYKSYQKNNHILRDIKRSTFHPKEEDYDISDANGSTSNETSMTRLSAQDFLKKFIFDVVIIMNRVSGSLSRFRILSTNRTMK